MFVRLALVLAVMLFQTAPSRAHAILVESTPAIGATVAGDVQLRLRYNSRIDRKRSRLTLTGEDQSAIILPILADGTDDVLLARIALRPGHYTLRWQVLAVDGHITRGDVPFTVAGN